MERVVFFGQDYGDSSDCCAYGNICICSGGLFCFWTDYPIVSFYPQPSFLGPRPLYVDISHPEISSPKAGANEESEESNVIAVAQDLKPVMPNSET